MSDTDIAIVGVGLTKFGKHAERSLNSLGGEAIELALADAGLEKSDIQMAFMANSMSAIVTGQASIVGQSILREQGFSGIPVFNIDNACASSSSALNLGLQAIRAGAAEVVLVVGVEKLVSSDRSHAYLALNGAADLELVAKSGIDPKAESVFVASIYPQRVKTYADAHGLESETLARISVKNRKHAATNPIAQYSKPITMEEVLASRQIVGPITALMCAPIGDGASAVIIAKKNRVNARTQRPVWVRGSAIGMGSSPAPGVESSIRRVSKRAYEEAGIGPSDVHVAEVHDSISFNEMLAYEELGLCDIGGGAALVAAGSTTIGGALPVNPSGGLESRGHPVAATGLAQICELVMQLRGEAGARQVAGARVALAENAGGFAGDDTAAIAVTILSV